ncbi:MAG: four helix bundle protein [Patescibacteria group bacterium]|jgi:hypothetical protein
MTELDFHTTNHTPPQRFLPVVEKAKTVYKNWTIIHRALPRVERFGLGTKIDFVFLELLELLRKSSYTPIIQKINLLSDALDKTDSLRFFIQLLWELKLIPNHQFSSLGSEIENIGRMINGWKKGLVIKTSATQAEERK